MGGYGSTRWGWSSKKTQVEECLKLTIYFLKPYLNPWQSGALTWSRGGQEIGKISYLVQGVENVPDVIRLIYTIGAKSGHPVDYDYPVCLTTSSLAWGKLRYWFICPAPGCGRRVGCLYLPPGGKIFACRHCYNLSYESRQEGYSDKVFYARLAEMMQEIHPGLTGRMMKEISRFW